MVLLLLAATIKGEYGSALATGIRLLVQTESGPPGRVSAPGKFLIEPVSLRKEFNSSIAIPFGLYKQPSHSAIPTTLHPSSSERNFAA